VTRPDGRSLGLDLGSRRIGVALSDPSGVLATPHTTIARSGDRQRDHRAVAALVADWDVRRVVVGLPRSLDGSDGPAARAVREEARELAAAVGVEVELQDERFSTVTADRLLAAGGRDQRRRRAVVDQTAAAVILQARLDGAGASERMVER
jgi:putative Holliday junction resolvase